MIGAGGHAHACIDVIEQQGRYRIAGLVGRPEELHAGHLGYSVIAEDADLSKLAKEYRYAFIAVGQIQTPLRRIQLYRRAIELGFQLPLIIAPTAYVSQHASVGDGTIIMHEAFVGAGVKVGANCIINTRALLEHDSVVEDHCHLSTGVIINGNVRVGEGCFLGSGCIVKEGVALGKSCVVGMGHSVRHHQPDHARYIGDDTK